jgi:glycine betaine/choline ABC-type transport system substrate-binding protein
MQKTIEAVQQGLSLRAMRELNARVDVDRETPKQVAHEYLTESGYIK